MLEALKLLLEYDGSLFAGWAAQPGRRTVQGELESAIGTVLGERPDVRVAGRTDRGVHALGQVASFETGRGVDARVLARSLNGLLPRDLSVASAEPAPDGFDARRDAISRTYLYRVLARPSPSPFERGRALWWPGPLDEAALADCAGRLPGTHDFTAFTPTRSDHVRFERDVSRSEWRRDGDVLRFSIEADSFMRHMVRVLVGTMLEVATGRMSTDDFSTLLGGAPRGEAGPTAPAHGLYLESVRYPAATKK